jgi:hypothetical protein
MMDLSQFCSRRTINALENRYGKGFDLVEVIEALPDSTCWEAVLLRIPGFGREALRDVKAYLGHRKWMGRHTTEYRRETLLRMRARLLAELAKVDALLEAKPSSAGDR